ncbi:hypothetical protein K435DRAFT_768393 [Dendrothele bispora CBS 962.96]|uniref:Uncharacterized protein n=1 Tax=Dendrothele bispora (strain CBS 962.96) TaxID=1314807 RepID=A0A4S8KVS0_DENBC|nr:hypothetical protein K435DRAFT_768393 [Dendrothele bispora CBS 962.96]
MVSPSSVTNLVSNHLGYDSTASIPKNYREELKHHLKSSPDDHNFRIMPTPGTGFGTLTCLQTGCRNPVIQLSRNNKLKDGGMAEGIGSLRAYRVYIAFHHSDKRPDTNKLGPATNATPVQDKKPSRQFLAPTSAAPATKTKPLTGTIERARALRPIASNKPQVRASSAKPNAKTTEPIEISSSPETSKPRQLKPLERARQRANLERARRHKEDQVAGSPSSSASASTSTFSRMPTRSHVPETRVNSSRTELKHTKAPVSTAFPEVVPERVDPSNTLNSTAIASNQSAISPMVEPPAENPRKRPLAGILSPNPSFSQSLEPSTPVSKKLKTMEHHDTTGTFTPLSTRTNTILPRGETGSSTTVPSPSSSFPSHQTHMYARPVRSYSSDSVSAQRVEEIRSEIDELQMRISNEQRKLDVYLRKEHKSKGDLTRIGNLMNEIEVMKIQREEWKREIPVMSNRGDHNFSYGLGRSPSKAASSTSLSDLNDTGSAFMKRDERAGTAGRTLESRELSGAADGISTHGKRASNVGVLGLEANGTIDGIKPKIPRESNPFVSDSGSMVKTGVKRERQRSEEPGMGLQLPPLALTPTTRTTSITTLPTLSSVAATALSGTVEDPFANPSASSMDGQNEPGEIGWYPPPTQPYPSTMYQEDFGSAPMLVGPGVGQREFSPIDGFQPQVQEYEWQHPPVPGPSDVPMPDAFQDFPGQDNYYSYGNAGGDPYYETGFENYNGVVPPGPGNPGNAYYAYSDDNSDGPPIAPGNERTEVFRKFEDVPVMEGSDHWDENGEFYGRGRDLYQGPVARADDIEKFLVEAGNAELFNASATVEDALQKLGLPNLYTPIQGMEVALMPHQTIGVAWMLEKEKSDLMGGILADDMGLGKTVQMISVMVKNRSENPECKTNLVLAPQALLDQWKMEIELKTNDGLRCLIYHGSSKPKKASDLLDYDVVLTTYHTMALEWPDYEAEMKKQKRASRKRKSNNDDDFIVEDDEGEKWKGKGKKAKQQQHGLLFQVEWYRIICDEAQVIRNKRTRMSRAVTELTSTYRWCLTGTPIVNSLGDVYSYLRFIKMRPWYDWTEFQKHIGKDEKKRPQIAVPRLQKILDACCLRRKKTSMLDGKRLVELPPKEVFLHRLTFTDEEREIYHAVETQSQHKFNRYLRAGTVLKNYSHILVLLLRLRQCCSHPALIQEEGGVAFLAADEMDDKLGKELKRARDLLGRDFVDKLKEKFKLAALEKKAENGGLEISDVNKNDVGEECPICFDVFTDPVVTRCAHVFCRECLLNVFNTALPAEDEQLQAQERPCPACRTPFCQDHIFLRAAFEPTAEELSSKVDDSDAEMLDVEGLLDPSPHKGKGKGHAKHSRGREVIDVDAMDTEDEDEDEDDDDLGGFIVPDNVEDDDDYTPKSKKMKKPLVNKRKNVIVIDSDEEEPGDEEIIFGRTRASLSAKEIKMLPRFFPSTKMKFMMDHIIKLAKDRPEEKTMVVSQWTGCLQLVSDYLEEHKIQHVKYQGDMNRQQRDKAVRIFMSKQNAKIMLMSLKCGGVGLNLTRANNVISLDLGWSQAIEDQAFDRVHRLGQNREVHVNRLVIENTVEDRILAMQKRKQALADGSLGEGDGKKIGRLTVAELANLFGLDSQGAKL